METMTEMQVLRYFKSMPPVRVVEAIKALGIRYVEKRLITGQSGYFKNTGNGYEIGVNATDGPQRKRFTAAHELGHYVLHRDKLGPGEHLDRLYDKYADSNSASPFSYSDERQANQFAADFLMPANLVSIYYQRGDAAQRIAERFEVSKAAADVRLKSLGLLP
ncbi:ImmA/IrrE family metallo-endopeptidase [Ahrensia kielensis]|uniref:ImmA/IrrE family metallo-endopeptidase n=1 Tax=Ahrensia kielensis TaxID=76980 RepID=A0ABU9T3Q4_9HYPH